MKKRGLVERVLYKVARRLGLEPMTNEVQSELIRRLEKLEVELTQLKSQSDGVSLDEAVKEIKSQFETFTLSLAENSSNEGRREKLEALAQIATSAAFSDEGLIENTHGERDKITVGEHSYVRGRLLTYGHGGAISIGEWCYVGARTEIWSMDSISIGNRVLISHDVNIHDGTAHSSNPIERHEHFKQILLKGHPQSKADLPGIKSAPVVIEDDAWISFGVTILRGVTIGAGSIIAAGAIVTSDVPPNVLYRCHISPTFKPLPDDWKSVLSNGGQLD